MTNDERLEVLEGLLAKVRRAATDRGLFLPQALPPGVFKDRIAKRAQNGAEVSSMIEVERVEPAQNGVERIDPVEPAPEARLLAADRGKAEPPRLTAFAETGKGNHAPLALVKGPTEAPPVSVTTRSLELDAPAPSAPLIEFSPVFDDEVTSTGDPEEVEAMMLAELAVAEEEEEIELAPESVEPAPVTASSHPPAAPVEAAPSAEVELRTPVVDDPAKYASSPPPLPMSAKRPTDPDATRFPLASSVPSAGRRSYAPRPSVPLELDIDDLDLSVEIPKAAPAPSLSALERAFAKRPEPAPSSGDIAAPISAEAPRTPLPATLASNDRVPAAPPAFDAEPEGIELESEALEAEVSEPEAVISEPALTPRMDALEPSLASPSLLEQIERGLHDEPVPESQRQKVVEARPVDDALEGVSEPPPESGPVESQRYASHARESLESQPEEAHEPELEEERDPLASSWASSGSHAALRVPLPPQGLEPDIVEVERDESPTPQPLHDVTAEVRSLGDVDVIERPAIPEVEVTIFRGDVRRPISSFGELLERALDLGGD